MQTIQTFPLAVTEIDRGGKQTKANNKTRLSLKSFLNSLIIFAVKDKNNKLIRPN